LRNYHSGSEASCTIIEKGGWGDSRQRLIQERDALSANVTDTLLGTARGQEQRSKDRDNDQRYAQDPNASKETGEALRKRE
jgi:hypothetical protein